MDVPTSFLPMTVRQLIAGGVFLYAAYVNVTWLRYGRRNPLAHDADADLWLDHLLPEYDVTERHHLSIAAPADLTFRAACELDMLQSPLVQGLFRARAILLGSRTSAIQPPRNLVAWAQSLGWGVLAEVPGRELVMGAVTKPWQADVVFRPLTTQCFLSFGEPDYVKIAWTLRVDPRTARTCVFRTETRVMTTDLAARRKFRLYWAFFSPGIIFLRWLLLWQLRRGIKRYYSRQVCSRFSKEQPWAVADKNR